MDIFKTEEMVVIPLYINCISEIDINLLLGNRMTISDSVVHRMIELINESEECLCFDFDQIDNAASRCFELFNSRVKKKKKYYFINIDPVVTGRIKDDTGNLFGFHTVNGRSMITADKECPLAAAELIYSKASDICFDKIHSIIDSCLVDNTGRQESTPVMSTKYFLAKRLFMNPISFRYVMHKLIGSIKKSITVQFDTIISASRNGAVIARPVAALLNKQIHCWVNFGPKYIPENALDWHLGFNRRCLFIADMVSMGTEIKVAQASITKNKSKIVACAAVAMYLEPKNMPFAYLAGRELLESSGYSLTI